jgi:methylglyoxal synthase
MTDGPVTRRRIAMVAHDNKKHDLLRWCEYNRHVLTDHELWATGTTGTMLEYELGLRVNRLLSGPVGGDQQVGAMIAENRLDVLIFFWDPLEPQPHDPDVKALLRLAALWNAPAACNAATADLMISSPLFGGDYHWQRPQIDPRQWNSDSGASPAP